MLQTFAFNSKGTWRSGWKAVVPQGSHHRVESVRSPWPDIDSDNDTFEVRSTAVSGLVVYHHGLVSPVVLEIVTAAKRIQIMVDKYTKI